MNRFKYLALIAFFGFCITSQAKKVYTVCNTKSVKLSVAYALTSMVQDSVFGTFHNINLRCNGWVPLEAGKCDTYEFDDANHTLYLYARDGEGKGYYPEEKNPTRFCIDFDDAFKNDASEMREGTKGCPVKGQWGVPFYKVTKANFKF